MSYHTINGLGIVSPTGQSWNTPNYQACMGYYIQQCGVKGYQGNWSTAMVTACIDTEQKKCIAQAQAALTTTLTSSQVKALQVALNQALQQHGYCSIGVDGNLGPTTCGVAAWAAGIGAPVAVPGVCGKTVPMGSGFLKDCAAPSPPVAPPPLLPKPAPAPAPVTPAPPVAPVVPYQPPKKANMLVVGGVAAMVAGGGWLLAKKKGWIK